MGPWTYVIVKLEYNGAGEVTAIDEMELRVSKPSDVISSVPAGITFIVNEAVVWKSGW